MKKYGGKLFGSLLAGALMLSSASALTICAEGNTAPGNGQGGGQPPAAPSGGTPPDGGTAPGGSAPGGMGGSSAVTSWTSVKDITADTTESGGTYDSTGTEENAIHVENGATAVLNDPTVTRTSSDAQGGDNASFYGVGAAVLTTDGTTLINGGTITTDANGGAGVFSYGSGITYVSGTTIRTSQGTSGGIHVAGGGTLYAWDLDVTTQGASSAAIRSDRGGGTMVVDGGTYTANGLGSPAVYVTADISIKDATLIANGSEGVCIEGKNTLRLFNSSLTSSMTDQDQNDHTWSVILYQSMSGDSAVGNSAFYMIDGSLTSTNGGLFYTTNTQSDFYLENVDISQASDSEYFLMCTGNTNQRGWGTSGANGADCNFTAVDQVMNGNVVWDSISQLDFYALKGSTLTGAIVDDESYAGNGGSGYANVYIDALSSWIVTGNSTVTNLHAAGTIKDKSGRTVSIVGTDGTVYVKGDSDYTITVTTYSTEVDTSAAVTAVSWSDYQVSAPEGLTITTGSAAASSSAATATAAASSTAAGTSSINPVAIISIVALLAALVVAFGKKKK